jgi:ParB family chromosome partitioning protein
VHTLRAAPPASERKTADAKSRQHGTAEARRIEELLRKRFQTKVSLHLSAKDKGEVRIAFLSNDDLERVLEVLGVSTDAD